MLQEEASHGTRKSAAALFRVRRLDAALDRWRPGAGWIEIPRINVDLPKVDREVMAPLARSLVTAMKYGLPGEPPRVGPRPAIPVAQILKDELVVA